MIYAICGTPGSFKSCYAVENFLLPNLKKGRDVFTNIEGLNPLYIATYYDLDPVEVDSHLHILGRVYDDDGKYHEDRDKIRKFYEDLPLNALVIIDEAQNYFSSRDFKEGFSADLIPWMTKHRHLGNDVVWITQNLESVDITFRRNTHLTYALRRTENLGLKNSSFNYIFDRADLDRKHLSRKMYRPDPTIFKLYSSYQTQEVKEERKSYNVLLRSPFIWFGLIVIGWALYTILSGNFSRNVFKTPQTKKQEKAVENVSSSSVTSSFSNYEEMPAYVTEQSNCIVRKTVIGGSVLYYFDRGAPSPSDFGLPMCGPRQSTSTTGN